MHGGGAIKKMVFNGAYAVKKAKVPVIAQIADNVVLSSSVGVPVPLIKVKLHDIKEAGDLIHLRERSAS
ncbi:hypothetical protein C0995_007366, partial [Termitomyces sp. Mi166